jgi:hypothetical protein
LSFSAPRPDATAPIVDRAGGDSQLLSAPVPAGWGSCDLIPVFPPGGGTLRLPVGASEAGDSGGWIQSAQGLGQLIDRGPELLNPLVNLVNLLGHLGRPLVLRHPCVVLSHTFKATPPPTGASGSGAGKWRVPDSLAHQGRPAGTQVREATPWATQPRTTRGPARRGVHRY